MALDFDVIVIGSGFGAAVAAIDQAGKGKTVFILERGVWWLTPELSAENPMNPFLKTQPVQYWARASRLSGGRQGEWGSRRTARLCQRCG